MIKIGFIDYYLDEWHANNYPTWIAERLDGKYGVCYAYGKINSPKVGGLTNQAWADKYGVELVDSIEELIQKSDRIVVLAPDNPETHEELTELALQSGKPVYIDKTMAPDKAAALRIFANADQYGTKCYSTSALRFAEELAGIDKTQIHHVYTEGPGNFEVYAIHQIEQIVMLMETPAKRVMFTGDSVHPSLVIEFVDGRMAQLRQCNEMNFRLVTADVANVGKEYVMRSDFFGRFIDNMLEFFETEEVKVPHSQTVDVIAIREAGMRAAEKPFVWVEL